MNIYIDHRWKEPHEELNDVNRIAIYLQVSQSVLNTQSLSLKLFVLNFKVRDLSWFNNRKQKRQFHEDSSIEIEWQKKTPLKEQMLLV